MSKQFLTNNETLAVVKCWGAGTTNTIDLQTDLLVSNRLVLDGTTQTVNIIGYAWAGATGSSIKITRNGVDIIVLNDQGPGSLSLAETGAVDTVSNTDDITVVITGDAYLYLTLRKAGGYKETFEPGIYGSYDNPNIVG